MPQLDAAKKELRKGRRRRATNDRWRQQLRTALKKVRLAITAKDSQKADAAYLTVQSVLDRAARRHILHPNVASRKKARLKKAIAKIQA